MSLSSCFAGLRLSTSSSPPTAVASSSRHYNTLGSLKPAPGSHRNRKIVGRGSSSGHGGHTTGRGANGQKSRATLPYVGFEGGQTPLHIRLPKRGGGVNFMARKFTTIPVARVQQWVAQGRLSVDEPITIRSLILSNAVHGTGRTAGVKLLGDVDPDLPLPPMTLHLSQFSKSAAKAILDAGGDVKAVYHDKTSLRVERMPEKFEGKEPVFAHPTRKREILYYTDPKNHGYLADVKEEFIKSLGYNPDEIWRKGMPGPPPGSAAGKRARSDAALAAHSATPVTIAAGATA